MEGREDHRGGKESGNVEGGGVLRSETGKIRGGWVFPDAAGMVGIDGDFLELRRGG